MPTKEKKQLIVLIVVAIIAIVVLFLLFGNKNKEENTPTNEGEMANENKYVVELDDGTRLNNSEDLGKTKKYKNLEISNIQFTEKGGMTVLLADVKNTGSTKHTMEIVKLTVLGDNGEVITEIKPVIGDVEPGQTIKLNASVTADVVNAKDFKIEAAK